MHMKLVRTIWGIRVVRVGGSISASRFYDLNISQRRAGNVVRPFGEYTLQTNVSNAFTSCGSSPLTNSVDDSAPSPRLQKQSMMGLSSSSERQAAAQLFCDFPTNFPPQSAPEKLCRPMRPWALRRPITCTHFRTRLMPLHIAQMNTLEKDDPTT